MTIDPFLLKKIVSLFTHLIPGLPLIMVFALLLLSVTPRFSRFCLWIGTVLLILFSSPLVSNILVGSLELRYPPLLEVSDDTGGILVLGAGHQFRSGRTHNSVLSATSLSRVTEGMRLWESNPDSLLITSGAQSYSTTSNAEVSALLAIEKGIPESKIRKLDRARDTEDEIKMAIDLLSKEGKSASRLVVVSSATHLARAEQLITQHSVTYSLAPTDFLGTDVPWFRFSVHSLNSADRAIHEYVGMIWHWIRSSPGF